MSQGTKVENKQDGATRGEKDREHRSSFLNNSHWDPLCYHMFIANKKDTSITGQ